MAYNDISFNTIAGKPLMYWRGPGPTGPGNEYQATFWADIDFHGRIALVAYNLEYYGKTYGGLGDLVHIVTAGVYVNKPGQHGLGQAFDLDRVRWANGTCTPYSGVHASGTRWVRRRYLATDAICRRWARWTLDGWYNSAHSDHIHFDMAALPEHISTGSRSDTVFIQKSCNDFNSAGLSVDGAWGPLTESAYLSLKSKLGTSGNPKTSTTAYRNFLAEIAKKGYADQSA